LFFFAFKYKYDKNRRSFYFHDNNKLEAIWKSEYSLKEILDPKNFKSYDELKVRLTRVLGAPATTAKSATIETATPSVNEPSIEPSLDEDEDMALFNSLAEEI
jgi:hypothetical protein